MARGGNLTKIQEKQTNKQTWIAEILVPCALEKLPKLTDTWRENVSTGNILVVVQEPI